MAKNELRRDPISGNWTIVLQNAQNAKNVLEKARKKPQVKHDSCEYCEYNETQTPPEIFAIRSDGKQTNVPGWLVRVVPEKYPVLQIHGDLNNRGIGIYDVLDGIGAHELIIETPRHGVDLAEFTPQQLERVFLTYRERYRDLKNDSRFRYILMHKSAFKGEAPRFSHSFSHVIATPITPLLVKQKLTNAKAHFQYKERCLFCDIIRQEQEANQRVVLQNERYIALSP
ncbi:MAG: galactose-1-phosphate uridylyltransferase, partial [Calditrichaeota bacterium]